MLGLVSFKKYPKSSGLLFLLGISVTFSLLFVFWKGNTKLEDVADLLRAYCIIFPVGQYVGKYVMGRLVYHRIAKFNLKLNKFTYEYPEIQRRTENLITFYYNLIKYGYSMGLIACLFQPVFCWDLVRPLNFWYAEEQKFAKFQDWLLPYMLESLGMTYMIVIAILMDTLPIIAMLKITGQIESLGKELENLPLYPEGAWNRSLNTCFEKYLRMRITCKEFIDLYFSTCLVQTITSCINLCAAVVGLSVARGTAFLTGAIILTCVFLQVLLPFVIGDMICSSSEKLQFQLYSSQWINLNKAESKKGLLIFMEVLRNPIKITFGKLFTLNLVTFADIARFAYKLYALATHFIHQGAQRGA